MPFSCRGLLLRFLSKNLKKKALITGITGQDGSYLAEFLLNKGYIVYGVQRRASWPNTNRIDHLYDNESKHPDFYMMYGDLADSSNLFRIINKIRPDEIYNLGAQSHVGISFDKPEYTTNINALGDLRILETIRNLDFPVKYYQASSSEMFGKVLETPQSEKTPFNPQSPYGISKDYVEAIWKILQHDVPDDFLISTGETHTVREFVNEVAKNLEIDLVWKGKGLKEKGVDKKTGKVIVEIDSNYFRPNEVDLLLGDSSKARKILGWKPRVTFKKLAQIMTDKDLEQAKIEKKIGSIVVNQKKFQIN